MEYAQNDLDNSVVGRIRGNEIDEQTLLISCLPEMLDNVSALTDVEQLISNFFS